MGAGRKQDNSARCALPAFTLVELLVAIGIIGLLVAILLPTLSLVRESARRAQCASNLRQLTTACTMHENEYREYPAPPYLPAIASAGPSAMTEVLLNALGKQLRWQPQIITPTDTVRSLPAVAVCPERYNVDLFMQADTVNYGCAIWLTGYCYFGRVDERPNNLCGTVLKPGSVTNRLGTHRAVLWTDTLIYSQTAAVSGYSSFHIHGAMNVDPGTGTISDPRPIRGQHRAYDDESVEWIPAAMIDLSPADVDQTTSYKIALPGGTLTLWYWL